MDNFRVSVIVFAVLAAIFAGATPPQEANASLVFQQRGGYWKNEQKSGSAALLVAPRKYRRNVSSMLLPSVVAATLAVAAAIVSCFLAISPHTGTIKDGTIPRNLGEEGESCSVRLHTSDRPQKEVPSAAGTVVLSVALV